MATELVIRISGESKKFRKELDRVEREAKKTAISLTKAFGPKANRNVANLTNSVVKLSKAEQKTAKQAEKAARVAKKAAEERERRTDRRIRNIKRVAAALAVLAVAGLTASVIEFAKFEQGLAGVSKTTNIVGLELEGLGDEITGLSIKLGTSTGELLELAKSAGQLGVKGSKNIIKFTETMAGLAKTTNIAGEEGAIALARLIKVTGENIDNVDRLASSIVDLGNNTAALEAEILFTAQQIGGAGKVFGITATQALGLAAAFAELAIPPELARGTILRAFGKIQKAISEGGSEMEKLILITGLTGEELEKTFVEDSTKVFGLFLKGVAKLPKSQLLPFLKDFELAGLRLEATLPKLALESNLVAEKVERAARAFDENTAQANELAIQLDTTLTRFKQLKAELAKTGREIGESFNPATESTIELFRELAPFIKNILVPVIVFLSDNITKIIKGFGSLGEIISGLKTITEESFNFIALQSLKLDKAIIETINNAKKSLGDFFSKIPGVKVDFDVNDSDTIAALEKIDAEIAKREQRVDVFFGAEFGPAIDTDAAQKIIEQNKEIAAIRAAAREEEKTAREDAIQEQLDRDAEILTEKIELEGIELARKLQAIEDKKERDKKTAKDEEKAQIKAIKDAEKRAAKAVRDLVKLKETRVKEEKRLDIAIADSAFQTLNKIVGDNKAAQLALLLAQKAVAVSRIIIDTQEASALAFASQLIPGDPTSLARAAAASAAVQAAGTARIGVVLATAIPELIGSISGAQDGGIVPGGFGGGDKVPFLLEPGEIITPERLNPLSPNFDEATGGGGGGEITVIIELTEDASQVLTASQREDTTLGVQL